LATETLARRWRWLALIWGLLVLAVTVHQFQFWRDARLNTDVMALLPENEQAPIVSLATRKLSEQAEHQVIVLVGATRRDEAQRAALAVRQALEIPLLKPAELESSLDEAVAFYRPWQDRLLTPQQRDWLSHATDDEIQSQALLRLYQPVGGAFGSSDALGLAQDWWSARAAESRVRPQDGLLWLEADGRHWVLLNFERQGAVFSASGDTPLAEALERARREARQIAPDSRVLAAGVPLHAESAAARANQEVSVIGVGSLLAVLLLVWLTFRSLRPIVLVGLSLLIGCAAALSATVLIFGQVHLLTLVFGASLVGVAEDYGFHYFAARQGQAVAERWSVLRHLLPGLTLALLTSALAYLALGLAPFPGLRQMAVFSAVGLTAAFLTVVCWFPLFDRRELHLTGFANRCAASLTHWPRWQANGKGMLWASVAAAFIAAGLYQLRSQDDLRQLQSSPPALIADQVEIGRLLALPSPAQFYLIEGDSPEALLQHEETLKSRLDGLVSAGRLAGYRAVSDWLPSLARQHADAERVHRAEAAANQAIAAQTGETLPRPEYAAEPLSPEQWLAAPASTAVRGQWLGKLQGHYYSVLLLNGLSPSLLSELTQVAPSLPSVRWVDKTAEYSGLLARYRVGMGWLLVLGYAAVLLALWGRFRRAAWRALLPTALGTLLVLACFGWLGIPLQLFTVLALVLLLGMGVDYGIFLLEHPGDGAAWLAVALAGVSTLLSFGLLALSSTPALHVFGLTMLIGEVLIWLLTPFFRLTQQRGTAVSSPPPRR
jgi:predicted exporter